MSSQRSPHIGLLLGVSQDVNMAGLERRHSDGEVLSGTDLDRGNVGQQVGVTIGEVETHQHRVGVVRVRTIIIITKIFISFKSHDDDEQYWGSCCRW